MEESGGGGTSVFADCLAGTDESRLRFKMRSLRGALSYAILISEIIRLRQQDYSGCFCGETDMRKSFVSLIANERYQVGCTGQTVYVLNSSGNELAKFRDMTYAYYPALHPCGDIAAVYSNTGVMAIYSLSDLRLITKFRVSAANDAQTGCVPCFSPDGQYLYHIEGRKGDCLNSRVSVYSTVDYRPVLRLFEQGQETVFDCMEIDRNTGCIFLLGYFRKENRNEFFVARLIEQSLQDVRVISSDVHDFYRDAIRIKQLGFTQQSYRGSVFPLMPGVKSGIERWKGHSVDFGPFNREYTLEDLKQMDISLPRFWEEAAIH